MKAFSKTHHLLGPEAVEKLEQGVIRENKRVTRARKRSSSLNINRANGGVGEKKGKNRPSSKPPKARMGSLVQEGLEYG